MVAKGNLVWLKDILEVVMGKVHSLQVGTDPLLGDSHLRMGNSLCGL